MPRLRLTKKEENRKVRKRHLCKSTYVLSTPNVQKSREKAKRLGLVAKRNAMKSAAADHLRNCSVAPGAEKELEKIQRRRLANPLVSLYPFLTRKNFVSRIHFLKKVACYYLPHGVRECKKLPKAFIWEVEPKRRAIRVNRKFSEAWVTVYDGPDVYVVDARSVFVTEAALERKSLIGLRALSNVQQNRIDRLD